VQCTQQVVLVDLQRPAQRVKIKVVVMAAVADRQKWAAVAKLVGERVTALADAAARSDGSSHCSGGGTSLPSPVYLRDLAAVVGRRAGQPHG
jgi:hypothetical protein